MDKLEKQNRINGYINVVLSVSLKERKLRAMHENNFLSFSTFGGE
jgi:hypothetical protein